MKKQILRFTVFAFYFILLTSASAAQTAPPQEFNKREADLLELVKLDKTIKLDIRYATDNNFVGKPVYPEARAFLQRDAAEAVARVHRKLKEQNLGLVIFDGYRPWSITKLFWEVVKPEHRKFVANPEKGSKHNRGCAVDLSIYDLKTGKLLPMPSGYDEFTTRAAPDYQGGTAEETKNRELLRKMMEAEGFTVNPNEWWHFDYKDWESYAIYDIAFSKIRNLNGLKGYRIRRVEFVGNTNTRDSVLRRNIYINEGDIFNPENLRKSIDGINKFDVFDKITEQDVSWQVDEKYVDFIFYLKNDGKTPDISQAEIEQRKDWKKFFDEANVTGGIYIYDLQKNKYLIYDRERMDEQFVPASTSKIIHSLIFLDSGAVRDETEVFRWDGVERRVAAWNQDHNLRTAFQTSAAWFYVEASKRVGREKMQKYYDAAAYGNRNTNGFGDAYWVKGDLKITPREQIEFLVKLYKNRLPFSPRSISVVKEIMTIEKTDKYTLRGKTGWSDDYTPQVGWFVGYVERGADAYFFAAEIDIVKDADAAKRKEITQKILREMKIIE